MSIGEQVREARLQRGLSVNSLARESGVAPSTVQRVESGAVDPTTTMAQRLLAALGKQLVVADRRPSDALREHADEVLETLHRHGAVDVRVFGSVARGDDSSTSDIDLLVTLPAGMGLRHYTLEDELSRLLEFPVDLVDDSGTSPALNKARAEAVPL